MGDSYDNALAETINGLFKTEVIRRNGPWKNVDAVEYATLEWVNWFNNQRLLSSIGYISPAQLPSFDKSILHSPCNSAVHPCWNSYIAFMPACDKASLTSILLVP